MRRRIGYAILLLVLVIGVKLIHDIRPYYTPAVEQERFPVANPADDTLRVAYIGDSWADGHKSHHCVIDSILADTLKRPVRIMTAGISGLTSKNIYYSIFRDDSVKNVIASGPDLCFVVAGINDTDRKMGKGYYQENMRLIISFLLSSQIVPVILEIPRYDIKYSYQRRTRQTKLLYLMSMLVTWSKMDCIDDYRLALRELIAEQGWNDQVIYVSSDLWNPDGYLDNRNLYDEGLMHLNARGYQVLDSCIAMSIINEYKHGKR